MTAGSGWPGFGDIGAGQGPSPHGSQFPQSVWASVPFVVQVREDRLCLTSGGGHDLFSVVVGLGPMPGGLFLLDSDRWSGLLPQLLVFPARWCSGSLLTHRCVRLLAMGPFRAHEDRR